MQLQDATVVGCQYCFFFVFFFMGFDCLLMGYDCEDRKVSAQDLRVKLQRKGLQPAAQSGKSSAPNTRDLRERLSGTMTPQPTNADPPKSKVVKPSTKNVDVETPTAQIKRPAEPAHKKSRKVLLYDIIFNCQLNFCLGISLGECNVLFVTYSCTCLCMLLHILLNR